MVHTIIGFSVGTCWRRSLKGLDAHLTPELDLGGQRLTSPSGLGVCVTLFPYWKPSEGAVPRECP